MAAQASEDVGREVVVEAESGNDGTPQAAGTEQISVAGSVSVPGGEHMFIETEVYTTTVEYVGNTELVHTDNSGTRQDDQQQQGEILEQVLRTICMFTRDPVGPPYCFDPQQHLVRK